MADLDRRHCALLPDEIVDPSEGRDVFVFVNTRTEIGFAAAPLDCSLFTENNSGPPSG